LKVESAILRIRGFFFTFALCLLPLRSAQGKLFAFCLSFFLPSARGAKKRGRRVLACPRAFALGYVISPLRGFPTVCRSLLPTAFCRLPTALHGGFIPDFRRDRSFVFKQIGGFVFQKV